MIRLALLLWIASLPLASTAANSPTFDFENVLNTYFDDTSGLISFADYTVAFAPERSFDGFVAVLDAEGSIVGQFPFFADYVNRSGVFARVRAQGPADVQLTAPGLYTIVYVVGGQPATRLPIKLEQTSSGADPFNPDKTFRFDGYWRTMAHLTMGSFKDQPFPLLTLWLGGYDLPAGSQRDQFRGVLLRDGKPVAHTKEDQGIITAGHFESKRTLFYHPHAAKSAANARPFLLSDWLIDGPYEIRIYRKSDNKPIRSFDFLVDQETIQPIARAALDFSPHTDHVLPRVLRNGATGLEMSEAIWIEDR